MKIYLKGEVKPVIVKKNEKVELNSRGVVVQSKTKDKTFFPRVSIIKITNIDNSRKLNYNNGNSMLNTNDLNIEKQHFAKAKGIDLNAIYDVAEASKLLGVSTRTIWRYIKKEELKYMKVAKSTKTEILGRWLLDMYKDTNLKVAS